MRHLLPAVLLWIVALTGCARVIVNGMSVREDWWAEVQRDVKLQASIDLSCPDVRVQLEKMQGKFPVMVTAEGCWKRALYQRQLRRSMGHATSRNSIWVLSGSTSTAPQPTSVPAQPTSSPPAVVRMRPATY